VSRNFAGRNDESIESNISDRVVRVHREPNLGGSRNMLPLPQHRFCSLFETPARFYFCEHQEMARACNNNNFTKWASSPSRQNAESFSDEKSGRNANAACRSGRGKDLAGRGS